jgi:transcriptional regulator with XRE-family HTH domain
MYIFALSWTKLVIIRWLLGDGTMFGLGKNRSKLGKFLDSKGITQTWLAQKSTVNKNTINDLCNGESDRSPTARTIKKIMKVINHEIDPKKKPHDFFDL